MLLNSLLTINSAAVWIYIVHSSCVGNSIGWNWILVNEIQKQKAFYSYVHCTCIYMCIASSQSLRIPMHVYTSCAHLFTHTHTCLLAYSNNGKYEHFEPLPLPQLYSLTPIIILAHRQTNKSTDIPTDTMEKGMALCTMYIQHTYITFVQAYIIILSKLRNWNHKPDVKWDIYRIPNRRRTPLSQANAFPSISFSASVFMCCCALLVIISDFVCVEFWVLFISLVWKLTCWNFSKFCPYFNHIEFIRIYPK